MKSKIFIYFISMQILFGIELSILTYNIHALPPIFAGDKPKKRIEHILNGARDYDLILFQENWIFSDKEIASGLIHHNIVTSKRSKFRCPIKALIKSNKSGLSFASKDSLIILSTAGKSFKKCSGWIARGNDCLSSKGFQHISIQIKGSRVDVYNTHLDAGNTDNDSDVRRKQIQELIDYIKDNSEGFALIIAGDININLMDKKESHIIRLFTKELDLQMVEWAHSIVYGEELLDYIFYRFSDSTKLELIKGEINPNLLGLSDHPPVEAIFNITER